MQTMVFYGSIFIVFSQGCTSIYYLVSFGVESKSCRIIRRVQFFPESVYKTNVENQIGCQVREGVNYRSLVLQPVKSNNWNLWIFFFFFFWFSAQLTQQLLCALLSLLRCWCFLSLGHVEFTESWSVNEIISNLKCLCLKSIESKVGQLIRWCKCEDWFTKCPRVIC